MFRFFQEHQKTIIIFLTIPLIVVFVFVFNVDMGEKAKVAGELYGRPVMDTDWHKAYRAVSIEAFLRFGSQYQQYAQFLDLEQQAWDRLMLLRQVQSRNIRVDDAALRDDLVRVFSGLMGEGGSFDQEKYQEFVTRVLRLSIAEFETFRRDSLKITRLQEEVMETVQVSDEEIREFHRFYRDQLRFKYLLVQSEHFQDRVEITPEALQAHFENHPLEFQIPPKILVQYVRSEPGRFMDAIPVSESALREYYESHQEFFVQSPETGGDDNGDATQDAAPGVLPFEEVREGIYQMLLQEKIAVELEYFFEQIYRQMIEHENFLRVAEENLLPVQETDWFYQDDPPRDIGHALSPYIRELFQLPIDDFLGPFLHEGDWLIFQVAGKEVGRPSTGLDEVREKVEASFRKAEAPRLAGIEARRIHDKLTADALPLEEATAAMGIPLEDTGLIMRRSPNPGPLGQDPSLLDAIFGLETGDLSPVLPFRNGRDFVIGVVMERLDADMAELDKNWNAVSQSALRAKQGERFQEWLRELRQEARLVSFLPPPGVQ